MDAPRERKRPKPRECRFSLYAARGRGYSFSIGHSPDDTTSFGMVRRAGHGPGKVDSMNAPEKMEKVIRGKRYSTATAALLAGDDYWDGHNYERSGTNTFLYRTVKGAFFKVRLTQWEGDRDNLEPLTQDEALELWEGLSVKRLDYEEAFPGLTVEDA